MMCCSPKSRGVNTTKNPRPLAMPSKHKDTLPTEFVRAPMTTYNRVKIDQPGIASIADFMESFSSSEDEKKKLSSRITPVPPKGTSINMSKKPIEIPKEKRIPGAKKK